MATAALAISAASVFSGGAQAATLIDFTDQSVWSGSGGGATASAPYGSLTVDLSSNPPDSLNFTQGFDGTGAATYCESGGGPLACDSDGVGVIDDEITNVDNTPTPPLQSITVNFSKQVKALSFHFLDLFFDDELDPEEQEAALVYANGNSADTRSFFAIDQFPLNGGYREVLNPFGGLNISSLTFFANNTNDNVADPDYALAGIEVQAVPLPAAGWLLLAGLGGLGALRRFRKA